MRDDLRPNGQLYLPGSGTEGASFWATICDLCTKRGPDDETGCRILAASFCGPVAEWTWQDGKPTCSAFQAELRLGIDGEPLPEPDPRQLVMKVKP